MHLADLFHAVSTHQGEFTCERINHPQETKTVGFSHVATPSLPVSGPPLSAAGRLTDFYDTFGSIVFYVDAGTGDAGKHIAHPDEWPALQEGLGRWLEHLDEEEWAEVVPRWLDDKCLVVGESPHTGNYILMPTAGEEAGRVFEFDHDGFEFTERADDLVAYVRKLLDLDAELLLDIASHMRFMGSDQVQWWILEMADNRGNRVRTDA